jgi:membrane protein YdbS with pleckstrin-like domain
METLFYDLSEAEFTKGRKILIWILAAFFFFAAVWALVATLVFEIPTLSLNMAIILLLISIFIILFAAFATIKRKNHFFCINDEKIEFRNGVISPKMNSFPWNNIAEIHMPHKQKKALLFLKNGSSFTINLMWIEKKKATAIRKHIYYIAKEKNINLLKT